MAEKNGILVGIETMNKEETIALIHVLEKHQGRGFFPPNMPPEIRQEMCEAVLKATRKHLEGLDEVRHVTIGALTENESLKMAECDQYDREVAKLQAQLQIATKRADLAENELWHGLFERLGVGHEKDDLDMRIDRTQGVITIPLKIAERIGLETKPYTKA